jgi:hypothetical protein
VGRGTQNPPRATSWGFDPPPGTNPINSLAEFPGSESYSGLSPNFVPTTLPRRLAYGSAFPNELVPINVTAFVCALPPGAFDQSLVFRSPSEISYGRSVFVLWTACMVGTLPLFHLLQ